MNIKKSIAKRILRLKKAIKRMFAPPPYGVYEHIVSLGYNCEIAYQLYRYYGYVESSLFNWCVSPSIADLIKCLETIDCIGRDFLPVQRAHMWRDVNHPLSFHGRAHHDIWKNPDSELLDKDKIELISRIDYLREKFKNLAHSSGKVLFVRKCLPSECEDTKVLVSEVIHLKRALQSIGMVKFELLIIVTEEHLLRVKKELSQRDNDSGILLECVSHYAPDINVTGGFEDKEGWERIWNKYRTSYRPKKRKGKYKFELY